MYINVNVNVNVYSALSHTRAVPLMRWMLQILLKQMHL